MNRPAVTPDNPMLRVAVCLVEPWAFADCLCLDGIEVRAMRRYARWIGRDLHWYHVPQRDLPEALARGDVDVAIGGLAACPELERAARLIGFGRYPLQVGEPRHSLPRLHVWAVRRSAHALSVGLNVFLRLRQWREMPSLPRGVGTDAAGSPEASIER